MAVAIVAVLVVAVVTDLPGPATHAAAVASVQSTLQEIESDVAPCSYALDESFSLEHDLTSGNLSQSKQGLAKGFLQDDYDACSYTDDSLGDLASLGTAGSGTSAALTRIASTALTWCVQDAFRTIAYGVRITQHQDVVTNQKRLAAEELVLNVERGKVQSELAALGRQVRSNNLTRIKLWRAP
ncbi:MAG: hypothetical protein WA751_04070 [Candidatus Dormiibacterota bacterium]